MNGAEFMDALWRRADGNVFRYRAQGWGSNVNTAISEAQAAGEVRVYPALDGNPEHDVIQQVKGPPSWWNV